MGRAAAAASARSPPPLPPPPPVTVTWQLQKRQVRICTFSGRPSEQRRRPLGLTAAWAPLARPARRRGGGRRKGGREERRVLGLTTSSTSGRRRRLLLPRSRPACVRGGPCSAWPEIVLSQNAQLHKKRTAKEANSNLCCAAS